MNNQLSKNTSPLIFGEILYDKFDNNDLILGGAPFNVAWHLQGFGLNPILISRVGNDEYGNKIIETVKKWGMYTKDIQIDDQYPTGIVSVSKINHNHKFDILPNQAYDYINYDQIQISFPNNSSGLIYHGTLALRNYISRGTIKKISKRNDKIFVDVNLRDPWSKSYLVKYSLKHANWLKCSESELKKIAEISNINSNKFEIQAFQVIQKYSLEFLIVTLGEKGAFIIDSKYKLNTYPVTKVSRLVDTVGAGDAFSAVSILGISKKWDTFTILKRAIEFSAKICQVKGAILTNKQYYNNLLKKWEL